jgi:hypothetical protein
MIRLPVVDRRLATAKGKPMTDSEHRKSPVRLAPKIDNRKSMIENPRVLRSDAEKG